MSKFSFFNITLLITFLLARNGLPSNKQSLSFDRMANRNILKLFDTNNVQNEKSDSLVEKKIIKKVFSIWEVRQKNKYVDSLTHHKSGISIIINKKPDEKNKYYWVQAGYNSNFRFEPYYNFYVYPPNLIVKFYDPMTDEILTLKEWRNKEKHK